MIGYLPVEELDVARQVAEPSPAEEPAEGVPPVQWNPTEQNGTRGSDGDRQGQRSHIRLMRARDSSASMAVGESMHLWLLVPCRFGATLLQRPRRAAWAPRLIMLCGPAGSSYSGLSESLRANGQQIDKDLGMVNRNVHAVPSGRTMEGAAAQLRGRAVALPRLKRVAFAGMKPKTA